MRTLFVGDLHLSADRPDITQAFLTFLDTQLHDTDALYILGDLFEVWVGDDIAEPFANQLADAIKQASQKLPIYFIHGNRDFLIGHAFAKRSGMTLLPEVYTLDLYGVPSVILHGDSLCTLDKPYQRFRRFRNMSWAKWLYAHLPKSKRLDIAAKLRTKSKSSNQQKSYTIMDVEPDAVLELLDATKTEQMIHGHTHRPAIHQLANGKRRIVVGDWYEQGSMLSISQDKIELIELPFGK
ncbi:UDP-2,3-diacylglucosamine diphosphatase [Shewanella schlegeliana]|uniref:UDP-2,3-diacylglucosamine hydrolase n=1 Tax=Shewanella schlegeliana TaxID=190308 RepID=A0ABS1SXI4_9GAMM|nr:UDP-2,3-diacylglucosamine diphosphatase [Shewanella schlegeliana]MBL4913260.1 UDP-2,3-diacylglucosamine diphosphatase [Shewanella schlegeliana]MCL1109215.1 UDP-2,3-diacylglucosamine diphosphatase [Shewanella schlegeliana]GIU24407.1 UDP-2,3-diacylglucosamine hydrolase [Shewanella schlegeliana]